MMINNNNNNKRKSSEPATCRITTFSSNNNNKMFLDRSYDIITPSICSPSVISASLYNAAEASSSEETDVSTVSRIMGSRTESAESNMALYGKISVIGRRREMEDAVTVELGLVSVSSGRYDYFGVYDGHGGFRVAHACRDLLHHLVAREVERERPKREGEIVDWEKVMVASFGKMDEEVVASGAVTGSVGSTAVVAVVGKEVVVVANCGDSRAVLSRGGVPLPLSNDHKPDRPDELARIEVSGGRVINWNGQRVLGILATSRSIGDEYLKPYVIAQPEVTVSKRNGADEFLILASDGLWDVITNELACQVVRKCLDGRLRRRFSQGTVKEAACTTSRREVENYETRATEAAAVLAELAMARGSRDNISVVVVELNKHGRCHEE